MATSGLTFEEFNPRIQSRPKGRLWIVRKSKQQISHLQNHAQLSEPKIRAEELISSVPLMAKAAVNI
jgi:hypothetical protein